MASSKTNGIIRWLLIGVIWILLFLCLQAPFGWDISKSNKFATPYFENLAQALLAQISCVLVMYGLFSGRKKNSFLFFPTLLLPYLVFSIIEYHLVLGNSTISLTSFSTLPNARFNWIESWIWISLIAWIGITASGITYFTSKGDLSKGKPLGSRLFAVLILIIFFLTLILPNQINEQKEKQVATLITHRKFIQKEGLYYILQHSIHRGVYQHDSLLQQLRISPFLRKFSIQDGVTSEFDLSKCHLDSLNQIFQCKNGVFIPTDQERGIRVQLHSDRSVHQFNIGPFEAAIQTILDSEPIMDSEEAHLITESKFPTLFISDYFFHFFALLTGTLLLFSVAGSTLYAVKRSYLVRISQKMGISRYGIGIQLIFSGFALVSLVMLAIILVTNFYEQNKNYRKLRLERKSERILKSWEANSLKLLDIQTWNENVANIQGTDFSVYNAQGELQSSSLVNLKQKQLLPTQFQEKEVKALSKLRSGEIMIRPISIDNQTILNEFIATKSPGAYYLSIPYLDNDKTLRSEFNLFLNGFLKAYAIIFAIFILTTIWITNQLSKPLGALTERISNFKIGQQSSPLNWKQDDEIGELVNSYNDLSVRLKNSIAQLAEQEREGAWKLMARQIAHEVKNPLTPLKLNLQLLEYKLARNGEATPDISDFIANLIKQVDHLTAVAESFANFSKIANLNLVDQSVLPIIEQEAQLYTNGEVSIHIQNEVGQATAEIDEKAFRQVCKNLITNSIQAKQENPGPLEINITLTETGIYFQDNAGGIPEDKVDTIFQPNITTKAEGMGLGLSISKQLCKLMNGNLMLAENGIEGCVFLVEIGLK